MDSMQKATAEINPYFNENELVKIHQKFKNEAIEQVCLLQDEFVCLDELIILTKNFLIYVYEMDFPKNFKFFGLRN